MSGAGTVGMRSMVPARSGYGGRALIFLLSCVLLAMGCLGGTDRASEDNGSGDPNGPSISRQPGKLETARQPPPGYTSVTAGPLSLAHPSRWQRVQPPTGWTLALQLHSDGAPVARIGVITAVPQSDDPSVVAAIAFAGAQLGAKIQQRNPDRRINVPGANGAIRVDYTFNDPANGKPSHGTDISVVFGGNKAATVRIGGAQDTMSRELADRITRTIAVKA